MKVPIGISLNVKQTDEPDLWKRADTTTMTRLMAPEVAEFSTWFQSQGHAPIIGVEKAILMTYIAWKLKG